MPRGGTGQGRTAHPCRVVGHHLRVGQRPGPAGPIPVGGRAIGRVVVGTSGPAGSASRRSPWRWRRRGRAAGAKEVEMSGNDDKRLCAALLVGATIAVALVAALAAWASDLAGGAWLPVLAPFVLVLV